MKKTLSIYGIILIGLFVILSILDYKSDYQAERTLWKINKEFAETTKDPKIIPTGTFNDIRKKYEHFANSFPKSKLVPMAELHIGHTYMAMKEFDQARVHFENFIRKYKENEILAVQAAVEITRTYALQENEAGVIKAYERVIADFPLTEIGLRTPLLLVDFFKNTGKKARAQKALDDAEAHYERLRTEYAGTKTELQALRMLTNCALERRDFEKALGLLEKILLNFPDPQMISVAAVDNIVRSINTISVTEMKSFERPIGIYSKFVEKYPNHPYTPSFQALIDKLKTLKDQDVGILLEKKE